MTRPTGCRVTILSGALLALTGLTLCGCTASNAVAIADGNPGEPPAPMQHPLLPNFPIPAGFEMVKKNSEVRNMGNLRIARCTFEGYAPTTEVKRFYEKYMPTADFTPREQGFVNNEQLMRFESRQEVCNIRIKQGRRKTTFVVDLAPLSSPAAGTGKSGAP